MQNLSEQHTCMQWKCGILSNLNKKNYGQWNVHDHTTDGWWAIQMLCTNVSLEKKSNFVRVLRRCYIILNTEKNTYDES